MWIVVPCYNEANRLRAAEFAELLAGDPGIGLIFVDDGSTDSTATLLSKVTAANPSRCRLISQSINKGKAEAVRVGLQSALAEGAARAGFWDADLATPLRYVARFSAVFDERPEIEVVMGSRVRMLGRKIDRSTSRHLVGRAYATLASVVLGLPVYDTQCGAKLFRRSAALDRALERPFRSRWSFDVELLQRLQREWRDRGIDRIIEVPLREWRDAGNSAVSIKAGAFAFAALGLLLLERTRLPLGTGDVSRLGEANVSASDQRDAGRVPRRGEGTHVTPP